MDSVEILLAESAPYAIIYGSMHFSTCVQVDVSASASEWLCPLITLGVHWIELSISLLDRASETKKER